MSIRKDFLWYMLFCLHDIWFLQTLIMEKLRYWSYVFGKGKREKRITCNGGCMNEKNREGKTWQSADLNQINPETCAQHLKRHLGFQKGTKKTILHEKGPQRRKRELIFPSDGSGKCASERYGEGFHRRLQWYYLQDFLASSSFSSFKSSFKPPKRLNAQPPTTSTGWSPPPDFTSSTGSPSRASSYTTPPTHTFSMTDTAVALQHFVLLVVFALAATNVFENWIFQMLLQCSLPKNVFPNFHFFFCKYFWIENFFASLCQLESMPSLLASPFTWGQGWKRRKQWTRLSSAWNLTDTRCFKNLKSDGYQVLQKFEIWRIPHPLTNAH